MTEYVFVPQGNGPATGEDNFVRAYVSDQGTGITEKDLPKIFEGRVENGKNVSYGGVGLGLANLVCNIVHGFVKVESEVGEGSTFSLYFPQRTKKRIPKKQLKLPF